MMKDKLLIIDGSNLLFQMFYGMPARIVNAEGKAIQGTLGFVGALLKIIRMVQPSHIVAVFDGEHENARQKIDGDYKGNRVDYSTVAEKDNPFSQLPDVYIALEYLSIPCVETTDCEADDLIASLALSYGDSAEIVISSFDSDFFQLITDRVTVLRYRGKQTQLCGCQYVADRFGIRPDQYADFKAMVGDPADNIKGAPKIGVKTAAWLLDRYGSLEGILAHAGEVPKPSIRRSLLENSERLRNNRSLIRLTDSAPELPLEALQFLVPNMTTMQVLQGIGLK